MWTLKSFFAQDEETSVCSTVQRAPEVLKVEEEEETPEDCCTESRRTNCKINLLNVIILFSPED